MFENKKDLESIKVIMQFQNEMINRVKVAREEGGVDYPYKEEWGYDTYYVGSLLEAPNGYQVEYIDNIGPYGNSGAIKIWENDERFLDDERDLLYFGVIDSKKTFVIGRVQLNGDYLFFPRLDRHKNHFQKFTCSEEEMAWLQHLLNETTSLTPVKNRKK